MRTPLQLLKEDLQFFLDRDFSYYGEEVRITFESHGEAFAAAHKARKAAAALVVALDAAEEDAARYRGWRALWCTPGDSGLEILNQHIGTGDGEAEHDAGIDAAIAEHRAKCEHRWLAYRCQDCGAPAPCVIGEADEE